MKIKIPALLKPKLGPSALAMLIAGGLCLLVSIWGGDERWAQTGTLLIVPGACLTIAYLIIKGVKAGF